MAESKRVCRVCGRAYTPCHSPALAAGVFRWQDVACSPECGAEYLARVMASRGKAAKNGETRAEEKPAEEKAPAAGKRPAGRKRKTAE